jgi:lipid-binding SYLF domain-containing protein
MRMRWKLVGLAGLAGVAATGAVIARRRRAQRDYRPDEIRRRLHERLAEVTASADADGDAFWSDPGDAAPTPPGR